MEQKANSFLETEPLGALMAKYAVPCVISLLVAALYNIVDQIFIANADYGNALRVSFCLGGHTQMRVLFCPQVTTEVS